RVGKMNNTRFVVSVCVITMTVVVVMGCGGQPSDRSRTDPATVSQGLVDCTNYNGYTAAIAEATIDCIGTVGPTSYGVDVAGLLQRSFSACTLPGTVDSLLRIDRLLSLQLRLDLPLANVCIAQAWTDWLLRIATQ